MYDAIIVGARCAGSPTAMLLARKGHRVLLVDRTSFPSTTINGHFIHPPGIDRLREWGLLDDVIAATGCTPITQWTFDAGPITVTGSPPRASSEAVAYAPQRFGLDKALVDGAVKAGAEVREKFAVSELLFDGDRVVGVRGSDNGRPVSERATIVIGADGMRSLVARAVGAPEYESHPSLTCAYWTYFRTSDVTGAEVYARERRAIIALPVTENLAQVFVAWPTEEFHTVRSDLERNFLDSVELAPRLAERIRPERRAHSIVGSAVLPNFLRRPYGPGWALVGDAGYHKDPFLAQGINDAFRCAELLSEAVDAGLTGRRPMREALEAYEELRNVEALPRYQLNLELAALRPPTPSMQQMLASLPGDQSAIDRFFGVLMSIVPPKR